MDSHCRDQCSPNVVIHMQNGKIRLGQDRYKQIHSS